MRITIILKDSTYEELQRLRGERIKKEVRSISMTSIIQEFIDAGLERTKEGESKAPAR